MTFRADIEFARQLDQDDPLAHFRDQFHIPKQSNGNEEIYFCGNSLGLQPKITSAYLMEELEKWQRIGVKGHFSENLPWISYNEILAENSAALMGALPQEIVMMNTLTLNLHLMMVSFFNPTAERNKILIEAHAFPSDHYAVTSHLKCHRLNPTESLLIASPRPGEELIRMEDLAALIEREGRSIGLILLPGVQYYTGQVLDMKEITRLGHAQGCTVGFDLAHAAGNVGLALHDWDVDFAAWCTYKYLNSGPGSLAGCFIHERHAADKNIPRFAGWWGHNPSTRFEMGPDFDPIAGAEGWQLSNPPILSLAAIRASLEIFRQAGGITALREKSKKLTGFLEFLLQAKLADEIEIITPDHEEQRGCQLSLKVKPGHVSGKEIFSKIEAAGITGDWREPDVIRVAPTPMYNQFEEVYRFVEILTASFSGRGSA
ncbi:MAG: kynureninase [SAR324 cluster bacterium]|nr:kynureninase [SAR324 cluster bacterium]